MVVEAAHGVMEYGAVLIFFPLAPLCYQSCPLAPSLAPSDLVNRSSATREFDICHK